MLEVKERLKRPVPRVVLGPLKTATQARMAYCGGAKALTDHHAVSTAREAIRKLVKDGTIMLKPNSAHTSMVGAVQFEELGDHTLALAGVHRKVKAVDEIRFAASKSQENQEKGIVVAGQDFSYVYLCPALSSSLKFKGRGTYGE